MSKRSYKIILGLAIICLAIAIIMAISGYMATSGPLFIAFFLGLSVAVKGFPAVRGLAFTILILAVVTTALYYPHLFVEIGGFELALLITPLVQVIMFGMGSSMGLKDFIELSRRPRAVVIGIIAQFTIMPVLAYLLALISGFPAEISAGLILLGCAPTSVTASLFAYLAKANVALAITVTSLTTLMAPFLLPFLMKLFAGNFVEINVLAMMWDMTQIVLIPIGAGLLFNHFLSGRAKWLDAAMPKVSMTGVALIVAIIIAAGRESLLNIGFLLLFMVLMHNVLGFICGYWMARLFRMDERDCRTIAIATGMQNAGLVSGIAKAMGKIATIGLASAVCGPIMGFTASIIASYWSNAVSAGAEEREDISAG